MKTFTEFVRDSLVDDFPDITDAEVWAYIHSLLSENMHFGDCTGDINACLLCELTHLLNEYREYVNNTSTPSV